MTDTAEIGTDNSVAATSAFLKWIRYRLDDAPLLHTMFGRHDAGPQPTSVVLGGLTVGTLRTQWRCAG